MQENQPNREANQAAIYVRVPGEDEELSIETQLEALR